MPKLVTVEQMHAIEAAADAAGISYSTMMDTAGRAVAERVMALIGELNIPDPRVAVLVGKGNNGGDGLVAARELVAGGKALVNVFLAEARDVDDPLVKAVQDAGSLVVDAATDGEQGYRVLKTIAANADIIIDALLGTGAHLPITGDLAKILRQVHQGLRVRHEERPPATISTLTRANHTTGHDPVIVAVDVPTGLDANTGALDPNALYANETITFEAVKPGLITFPGAEAVGKLHVVRLGLPDKLDARDLIGQTVVDSAAVRDLLPKRPLDSNKGTFGRALVVAGSVNYIGAASLVAESAYRIGTGLVTVGAPQPIVTALATTLREATWILLPHDMGVLNRGAARAIHEEIDKGRFTALVIGPGLGQEDPTADFLGAFLQPDAAVKPKAARPFGFAPAPSEVEAESKQATPQSLPPLIVDADALNLLAKVENWSARLPADTILTPHPGEMARLIGKAADGQETTVESIQADRIKIAIEKAAAWHVVIVLKGAFTVIAAPDGRVAILPFANPGLAHAGTGDVLAGMIGGLRAQGLSAFDAAVAGAYLHGYAGELAVTHAKHPASVLASDVIAQIGSALAAIEAGGS